MNARIRTVKPNFFLHSLLFQLGEITALGPLLRLAYVGLWCYTDREARFEWKPREFKQAILPYDAVDFAHVLNTLGNAGFVVKYRVGPRYYGWIPRFLDHQNLNGREQTSRLPAPPIGAEAMHERMMFAADFDAMTRADLFRDPPLIETDEIPAPDIRQGYVYFMRDGRQVKIGFSANPWARVLELQTARPKVRLVGMERGDEALERTRHRQFASARVEREWFRLTPEIEAHIATCLVPVKNAALTDVLLRSSYYEEVEEIDPPSVSASNSNDLTRGPRDTWGREGKGREGNRELQDQEQQIRGVGPSVGRSQAGDAPTLGDAHLSPDHETGADRGSGGQLDGKASILAGGDGTETTAPVVGPVEVVDTSARGVRSLPAVQGPHTAVAIRDRMATVFREVEQGQRTRMKREQLAKLNAEIVFLYWAARFDHPRAVLDAKREARILARLQENGGDVSELLYALDGASRDDHIMGRGKSAGGPVYDGIETVLRDRGQVERFSNTRKRFKAGEPHPALAKMAAAMQGDAEITTDDGG